MAANNETGVVQSLRPIGKLARACGAAFHTDATQLCGKGRITAGAWLADYVSLSAHKFYGPKGAGVLYRKRGAPWWTPVYGGRQEHGIRPGTENVAAIVGLAEALEHADDPRDWDHARALRQRLWTGISSIPDVLLNTALDASVGNTLNVSFLGLSAEALTLALDLRGISVSTGAACHGAAGEPSHVLLAMGRTRDEAQSAIRFSVGRDTTTAEIDLVVEHVATCVARLRACRPQRTYALRGERAS
jgi:cysteine desulfurase